MIAHGGQRSSLNEPTSILIDELQTIMHYAIYTTASVPIKDVHFDLLRKLRK